MAVAAPPRRHRDSTSPLRLVTAVPLCDGHDSAIMTINHELVRHGAEVVYLGYHQSASTIARAAVQEDVHAIGISSYNGGHAAFCRELCTELRARCGADIRLFIGGGGTLTPADERILRRVGVERVFFAGTPLGEIVRTLGACARRLSPDPHLRGDRALSRAITLAGRPARGVWRKRSRPRVSDPNGTAFVLGVAGPGGAGKSTLIDELAFRFLRHRPKSRLAILANDPSHPDSGGALLGDRVSAIYSPDDRVFFRSLATRGRPGGISAATLGAIDVLRRSGEFELIIVESIGVGQDGDPFHSLGGSRRLADAVLFVTPPHYGSRLQLEKIPLLRAADLVALNKCDDARATAAKTELAAFLARAGNPMPLQLTIAAQHQNRGVDLLYAAIADLANLEGPGGERTCQLRIHE